MTSFVYSSPPFHITGSKKVDESWGPDETVVVHIIAHLYLHRMKMRKLTSSSCSVQCFLKHTSAITAEYLLKYLVFTAGPSE